MLAAIERPSSQADLAEMMVTAATDHFYLDGGHVIDFINKAFELLDRIGWEHAADVLPSLIRQLSGAQRSEEQNSWRSPVDLVTLLSETFDSLNQLLKEGRGRGVETRQWIRGGASTGTNPQAIVAALNEALRQGCAPSTACRGGSTGRGAAHRQIPRAQTSSPTGSQCCTPFRTPTHCIRCSREPSRPRCCAGVYHGAMRVYLDRFPQCSGCPLTGTRARQRQAMVIWRNTCCYSTSSSKSMKPGDSVNSFPDLGR